MLFFSRPKKCTECKKYRCALPEHLRRVHSYSIMHAHNVGRQQRVNIIQGSKLAELEPCVVDNCLCYIVRVGHHLKNFHKYNKGFTGIHIVSMLLIKHAFSFYNVQWIVLELELEKPLILIMQHIDWWQRPRNTGELDGERNWGMPRSLCHFKDHCVLKTWQKGSWKAK